MSSLFSRLSKKESVFFALPGSDNVTKVLGIASRTLDAVLKENLDCNKSTVIAVFQAAICSPTGSKLCLDVIVRMITFLLPASCGKACSSSYHDEYLDGLWLSMIESPLKSNHGWRMTGSVLSGDTTPMSDDARIMHQLNKEPTLFFFNPQPKQEEPKVEPLLLTWH